jgi:hypothetical protein
MLLWESGESPRQIYVLDLAAVPLSLFMAHARGMNVQLLPKLLSDAYTMFDSLNLSVTALVAIGLVLGLVFIFAAREAASWFFKIDDLKKDVKKVSQLIVDMEAEVRMLQGLLSQNVKLATPVEPPVLAPALIQTEAAPQKTRFSLNN